MNGIHRALSKRIVLTGLASLAIAGFAACGGASASVGDSILFSSHNNGEADIYVADGDGETTQLTIAGGDDRSAKWAPNRSQIAFLSLRNKTYDIWLMAPDGTGKREVFSDLGALASFEWSPDSRRIAFEIEKSGKRQIVVGDIESGETAPLTSENEDARLGSWSPNGEWIVYSLDGIDREGIYKGNPDGVNEIEVSVIPGSGPVWSPDGKRIVFMAELDGFQNLFVVPSDGGDEDNLTPNAENNFDPVWSRDGQQIAFVSDRDGNLEIYVIDSNGRNEQRLTSNRETDQYPSWSRRTNRIAFASDVDGDLDLFSMRPNGSDQRRITFDDRDMIDIDW